jgi:hypothetical protein
MLTVAAALLLAAQAGSDSSAQPTLKASVRVELTPDTVTIGEPFLLTLRVAAPPGARVLYPKGPGADSRVRLLDPVQLSPADSGTGVRAAIYRMAAWDVRAQEIDVGNVVVQTAAGSQELVVRVPPVIVRSLLPSDSTQRGPRPARAILAGPFAWWYPWVPLALLVLMLAAIFVWWMRRRRTPVAPPSALVMAQRAFRRIEDMRLQEAGEHGRFVALTVDALRDFLTARLTGSAGARTSAELIELARESGIPEYDQIAALLAEADRVKFAAAKLTAARARRLADEAMEIVGSIGDEPAPVEEEEPEEIAV